jgi:hypothetical protein
MPALPTLLYNKKSRVSGEALVYYNLGRAQKIGTLFKGASTVEKIPESSCGGTLSYPTSGFVAAVVKVPNEAAITIDSKVFPLKSPVGLAQEITSLGTNINSYTFTGGNVGDQIDIVMFPYPGDDVLICYDRGLNATVGQSVRAIARKFNPADHYVRQLPENTLNLTDLYVGGLDGVRRLNGIEVTLIQRTVPDGGLVPNEILYFSNVRLSVPPTNSGADAGESIEIQATGNFGEYASFAATPT